MKKIFTLVFAVGSITFASAQSKNGSFNNPKQDVKTINAQQSHGNDFDKNKNFGYDAYSFSARDRDAAIRKINREYDQKIADVRMNRRIRQPEKTRQIRMLENQRKQEIKQVELRYQKSQHSQPRNNSHHY